MVPFFIKMIVLDKNNLKSFPLTLWENSQYPLHDYLLEFTNDITGEKKYYTPTDTSPAPERYNEFMIDPQGLTGFSSYIAYEMPPTSPRSTDVALAYGIVETGKVLIIDSIQSESVSFDTDDKKNNAVFE